LEYRGDEFVVIVIVQLLVLVFVNKIHIFSHIVLQNTQTNSMTASHHSFLVNFFLPAKQLARPPKTKPLKTTIEKESRRAKFKQR